MKRVTLRGREVTWALRHWIGEHHLGALLVSGVGLVLAGLSLWYLIVVRALHFHDLAAASGGSVLLILEICLLGAFSFVLVYAGYWLASSPFETARVWWAGLWTLIGLAGIAVMVTLAFSTQILGGQAPATPSLIQTMLLAAGGGSIAGLLIGVSTIRETAEAERARRQQETLLFVNRLLRHNVLNGMQAIEGNASLLEDHVDAEAEPMLETIEDSSDRIVDLVQNVRFLVASISGETPIRPTELDDVLEDAAASVTAAYPEATIEPVPATGAAVMADDLLVALFENLLRNAVEHNDAAEPVVSTAVDVGVETVSVRIADDGPGIPPRKRRRYLEPGVQSDTSGGQGLGLYLVSTLLERYEGSIHFADNDPRGTVVTVELPHAAYR